MTKIAATESSPVTLTQDDTAKAIAEKAYAAGVAADKAAKALAATIAPANTDRRTELCPSQIEKLAAVIAEHPNLAIIRCADEKTGRRFGRAVRRAGMCTKIGSGGRSPGSRISAYQIWASWAPADLT